LFLAAIATQKYIHITLHDAGIASTGSATGGAVGEIVASTGSATGLAE
jgi:hypothetical protein